MIVAEVDGVLGADRTSALATQVLRVNRQEELTCA